jgi:hypothetical protein
MLLLGEDRSLGKALMGAGKKAEETGHKFGGIGTIVKGLVAGAAVAGVVEFGKKSVDTFKEVGGEVLGLQRRIGGTPEQVSRLNFAFEETGISAETAQKSLGILEKHLVATDGSGKKTAAMVKDLGFHFRGTNGAIKPMDSILVHLAEKFAKMPNGAEKTALAMKLFGKSGADMLPFLNKGAEGIRELEQESDKLGHTLSGKDLDAIKKSKMAHREWAAAVAGVKIQLGAQLLPIMNQFMQFLIAKGIPNIVKFIAEFKKGVGAGGQVRAVFQQVGGVVKTVLTFIGGHVGLVTQLSTAFGVLRIAFMAVDAVMGASGIGLVIKLIALLAAGLIYAYQNSETFRNIVNKAFELVKAGAIALALVAIKSFHFLLNVWLTVAGGILDGAAWAFGWVPGLGPKLQGAAQGFHHFKDSVNHTLSQIETNLTVQLNTGAAKAAADGLANYVRTRNYTAWLTVAHPQMALLTVPSSPVKHAAGGRNIPAGWSWVGENGPELTYVPGGSDIYSNRQSMAMVGGRGGGDIHLTVNLRAADGRVIQQELLRFKRQTGGMLGLA